MLLSEFSGLRIVVIYVLQGRVARYRNGSSSADVSLLLPTRRADYNKLKSLSGEKQEHLGNVVGAADAFFGGFAAGWCRGLGVERSLVWAYGAGQLCGLLPTAQLDVGMQELRDLLHLELPHNQRILEDLFPEPNAASPLEAALQPATFFSQNQMHLIALRGLPSQLPMLMDSTSPGSQRSLEELSKICLLYTSPSPRDS